MLLFVVVVDVVVAITIVITMKHVSASCFHVSILHNVLIYTNLAVEFKL